MILKFKLIHLLIVVLFVFSGCDQGPKVVPLSGGSENSDKSSEESPKQSNTYQAPGNDLHRVVVNEVLPASKYVYLNVNEGDEQFWIAIRKQDINVGEVYFYKGGLLKTNYKSSEYNRVFEKIYLVKKLVASDHGNNLGKMSSADLEEKPENTTIEDNSKQADQEKIEVKGSIKIAELVDNYKKYEGKTIQLSGKCVKINPNIMGMNWIHLQDGSKDDFDLVITSNTFVKEGSIITMSATVTLNKDFGAGYTYDLILENGKIVPN